MQYILGVDLGTSATKTILFDEKLQPIQTASAEYPLLQPQNGWAASIRQIGGKRYLARLNK